MTQKKGQAAKNAAAQKKTTPAPKPPEVDHEKLLAEATETLTNAEKAVVDAQSALDTATAEGKTDEEKKPLQEALDTATKTKDEASVELDKVKAAKESAEAESEKWDGNDEEAEELPEGSYTVKVNLKHNGQRYAPGDVIEIGGDEGALLLAQ